MKRMLQAVRNYFSGPRNWRWWLERSGAALGTAGAGVVATLLVAVNYGFTPSVAAFATLLGSGLASAAVGMVMLAVVVSLNANDRARAIPTNY